MSYPDPSFTTPPSKVSGLVSSDDLVTGYSTTLEYRSPHQTFSGTFTGSTQGPVHDLQYQTHLEGSSL